MEMAETVTFKLQEGHESTTRGNQVGGTLHFISRSLDPTVAATRTTSVGHTPDYVELSVGQPGSFYSYTLLPEEARLLARDLLKQAELVENIEPPVTRWFSCEPRFERG